MNGILRDLTSQFGTLLLCCAPAAGIVALLCAIEWVRGEVSEWLAWHRLDARIGEIGRCSRLGPRDRFSVHELREERLGLKEERTRALVRMMEGRP